MFCLEVSLNEELMWCAAIESATMLSFTLGSFVGAEDPAFMNLRGMCDLPGGRCAHVYWGDVMSLHPNDTVRVALVESTSPSPPTEVKATDSPEYLEEQRQFEEFERAYMGPTKPVIRRWPAVAHRCIVNGECRATATVASDEEHILCSLFWDQWRPGHCRVYVRSFGGLAARSDTPPTKWLEENLRVNEFLEVQVLGA